MDFVEILEHRPDESERLEYKDKRADNASVVKNLVALANNNGGKLFYGIRESNGVIEEIQDITNYSQFEEDISQTISSRVDPILPVDMRKIEYGESTVVGMKVDHQGLFHTLDTGNNKPCIPMRVGSTTDYLGGATIREFYRSRFESTDSGLTGWLDQVRKQAHKVTYAYEKNDFTETRGRAKFATTGNEVADEIERKLEQPHRELLESTAQAMSGLVSVCREMYDMPVSAKKKRSLNEFTSIGYVGYTPEEVEKKFREKAKVVNEAAVSLKTRLEDQNQKTDN